MFRGWLKRHADSSVPQNVPFVPVYTLEQLAVICRLPIVVVLPFVPSSDSSATGLPGPGVGGLIANLLRRNLLLTRQLSVLDMGDSGFKFFANTPVEEIERRVDHYFQAGRTIVTGNGLSTRSMVTRVRRQFVDLVHPTGSARWLSPFARRLPIA